MTKKTGTIFKSRDGEIRLWVQLIEDIVGLFIIVAIVYVFLLL